MAEEKRRICEGGEAEIIEKKSRFIANIVPVDSETEAVQYIEKMKKKYWNAAHNCFAYRLEQEGRVLCRFSDDGEPGGTAGKPILDVLEGQRICNAVAVITRYFGGTLLGTGGLVRAYGGAAQKGLAACTVLEQKTGTLLSIRTDYSGLGKIQYVAEQMNVFVIGTDYTEQVIIQVLVPQKVVELFQKKVTEVTSGKARLLVEGNTFYGSTEGKFTLF